MNTPIELRVCDALSSISHHVYKQGLDNPEGLTVTMPLIEKGLHTMDVTVTVQIHVEDRDDLLQQAAEQALGRDRAQEWRRARYNQAMDEQLRREAMAIVSGNADD